MLDPVEIRDCAVGALPALWNGAHGDNAGPGFLPDKLGRSRLYYAKSLRA
jgi:hypothetical protein